MSGVVKNGELVWEESGKKVPLYPGSYFSPVEGDESWKSPVENVVEDDRL